MDEQQIQVLYDKVVGISKTMPPNEEEKHQQHEKQMRKDLYFQHIENVLESLCRDICKVPFENYALRAATEGKRKALVFELYGYYGPEKVELTKEGVRYEGFALPVQFLAKGPKKTPQNRLYGLKFFTMNGIEPLVSRLQLRLNPFQVSVDIVHGALHVYVGWEPPTAEPADDVVSLEGSEMDLSVEI